MLTELPLQEAGDIACKLILFSYTLGTVIIFVMCGYLTRQVWLRLSGTHRDDTVDS